MICIFMQSLHFIYVFIRVEAGSLYLIFGLLFAYFTLTIIKINETLSHHFTLIFYVYFYLDSSR